MSQENGRIFMKKKKSKNSSVFLNEEKDVALDSSINEEDMLQGI